MTETDLANYAMRPRFRLRARKARAVAMSDDLIAVVGPDGLAAGLRLVRDPADPARARIVYRVQGREDFELMEGPIGPVWASFDAAVSGFREDAFPSERFLARAAWALSVILALLVGIWLAWTPGTASSLKTSAPATTWNL